MEIILNDIIQNPLLSLVALFAALVSTWFTISWRAVQKSALKHESAAHRESHNLALFEALAARNHQMQLAAAAILAERLRERPSSNFPLSEHRTIARAMLAVTKDRNLTEDDPGVAPELAKFIADQIALHVKVPLSDLDFQGANLKGANWKGLSAQKLDFWGVNLSFGTLRQAKFRESTFVDACFDGSNLTGVDFSRADLRRASFKGAKIIKANFSGADLRGVDLSSVASAEGAIFDGITKDESTKIPLQGPA